MGSTGSSVGGVDSGLLNLAKITSTASSAPASNRAINGATSSTAWATVGRSPISWRAVARVRPMYLKYPIPLRPTPCSSTSTPRPSSPRARCCVSRIRFALNPPHSPRLLVMKRSARRRGPPSGCRSSGNRSTRPGSYRLAITWLSDSAYGRAATTRSCARFSRDVATISIVLVIWRVFSTDLMRRRSSRALAIP